MQINDLVREAYENAKTKGFHDKPATFGDRIALIHSEASEALEAFRDLDNDSYDAIRVPIYLNQESGYMTRDSGHYSHALVDHDRPDDWVLHKPEGVCAELADIVIRVADLCGLYGIDLEKAIKEKLSFNKTRPYRHGGKLL